MPVQHTFMGRPIPPISPRRIAQLLVSIAIFSVVTLVFTLPKSIPSGPSLSKFTENHKIPIPKIPTKLPPAIFNAFRDSAHTPPVQENSTSGDSSWYSNWNWLSPFSSSVTLDESRSLLPPIVPRPPVYTYYDVSATKDEATKAAENELLLTWRRAWWALGFKPSILGPADAMRNPQYEVVQKLRLETVLQSDMLKWLAWEFMGSGVFTHYTTLPMGSYEDTLLSYLRQRQGDYPHLTRYNTLGDTLMSGAKKDIAIAVASAIANPDLKKAKLFLDAVPTGSFQVDPFPEAIASYDLATIKSKYVSVHDAIVATPAKGLDMLNTLINSHLHNTWQSVFSSGIAVLKPSPEHMSAVVEPALEFAVLLAQCSESPLPASCPPNLENCRTCVASIPLNVETPPHYRNTSSLFTIGTVPHPYTFAVLNALKEDIDVPFIRRQTQRDAWLTAITKEALGTGVSSAPRVVKLKEAVASPYGTARSIWFTAERPLPADLDWHFGFIIPREVMDDGKSETPVPGPERRPKRPGDQKPVDEAKIAFERRMLEKAKVFGKSPKKEHVQLKAAIESWNLADVEAWRFARAYLARSKVERVKWEQEEEKAVGTVGTEHKGSKGWASRWRDSN